MIVLKEEKIFYDTNNKLKLCGISEDFLFPDNTEVVCNAIKQAVKNKLYYPD